VREGEELLNPTCFMQSTHNTISSLVAIDAKCRGYNSTYAHKGISFECALQDAFLQLQNGQIKTALVGAHDEMTPAYFKMLKKAGFIGQPNQTFASETAVAMMLGIEKSEKTLCKIEYIDKRYATSDMREIANRISQIATPDYIMLGTNGTPETDKIYYENCQKLFPNVPLLQYKNIFGESYTAPALGVYAAAMCLQRGEIPDFLICVMRNAYCDMRQESRISQYGKSQIANRILCYNHFENKNHTFVLLSKI
jgi:3-oxoacyl-(acyl-carrier-protein) synthase